MKPVNLVSETALQIPDKKYAVSKMTEFMWT